VGTGHPWSSPFSFPFLKHFPSPISRAGPEEKNDRVIPGVVDELRRSLLFLLPLLFFLSLLSSLFLSSRDPYASRKTQNADRRRVFNFPLLFFPLFAWHHSRLSACAAGKPGQVHRQHFLFFFFIRPLCARKYRQEIPRRPEGHQILTCTSFPPPPLFFSSQDLHLLFPKAPQQEYNPIIERDRADSWRTVPLPPFFFFFPFRSLPSYARARQAGGEVNLLVMADHLFFPLPSFFFPFPFFSFFRSPPLLLFLLRLRLPLGSVIF